MFLNDAAGKQTSSEVDADFRWSDSIAAVLISMFSGNSLFHLFGCELTGFLSPRLLHSLNSLLEKRAAMRIWEGFGGEVKQFMRQMGCRKPLKVWLYHLEIFGEV